MDCELCAEQGVSVPPGGAPKRLTNSEAKRLKREKKRARRLALADPRPQPKKLPPDRKRPLPIAPHHTALLRDLWARVTSEGAGGDPDSRLLALTCALRGAIKGKANFTAQDLRMLRLEDPHAALSDLTSSGWLGTTPETVINADAARPALCDLPSLEGDLWKVGNGIRSRSSGWFTRTLGHKKLRKKPNRLRLVAAYLPLQAETEGRVDLSADTVVAACALSGTEELSELLVWLSEIGWLEGPTVDDGVLTADLTEITLPLAPQPDPPPTPPATAPATTPLDVPVPERAQGLLLDHESEVARWVGSYRDEHRHGPSWGMVAEAFGWPSRHAPDHDVAQEAFRLLGEGGWLTGFGTPFGLRAGDGERDR